MHASPFTIIVKLISKITICLGTPSDHIGRNYQAFPVVFILDTQNYIEWGPYKRTKYENSLKMIMFWCFF